MPKTYSSNYIIKILLENGFYFVSQKGSHSKYKKDGKPSFITIIPVNKKEIPFGTFKSILRQSKLERDLFDKI